MNDLYLILIGLFLPLFPMSMVFNTVFAVIKNSVLRALLIVAWPISGLTLLDQLQVNLPDWVLIWGIATSLLYGLRLLTIREVGLWTSFLATSAWALLWVPVQNGVQLDTLYLQAMSFSATFVLLIFICAQLSSRFGAAYVGLYGGLAETQPRLAGVLVIVLLAVIATPVFPSFFSMLQTIVVLAPQSLLWATLVGVVWLLWSWAGARVIQGLIVGAPKHKNIPDINGVQLWAYSAALIALVVSGLYLVGELL